MRVKILAGAPRPLLTGEEYEGDGRPRLDLSYHRHYYALGAHWSSEGIKASAEAIGMILAAHPQVRIAQPHRGAS